jgi:hypothetical protein
MIEIMAQIKPGGVIDPHTTEDYERMMEKYKVHQIVKLKISGAEKERSLPELNLFNACAKLVADNMDDPKFNTKEKVKIQAKIDLKFIEGFVVTNDNVQAILKTLSFTKTNQAESHRFISQALDYFAEVLGITTEKLISETKARMGRR